MGTFFAKPITVYAVTTTSDRSTKGKMQEVRTLREGIIGTIQQFRGDVAGATRVTLREGAKGTRGRVKIYTPNVLNKAKPGTNIGGDIVVWNNKEWEIIAEGIFDNGIVPHNKYIAEYRREITV